MSLISSIEGLAFAALSKRIEKHVSLSKDSYEKIEDLFFKALKSTIKDYKNEYSKPLLTAFRRNKNLKTKIVEFQQKGIFLDNEDLLPVFQNVLGINITSHIIDELFSNLNKLISHDNPLNNELQNIYLQIIIQNTEKSKQDQQVFKVVYKDIPPLDKSFVRPNFSIEKTMNKIGKEKPCLLYGLPGSGKSVIAAYIAVDFKKQKKQVFWFRFQKALTDIQTLHVSLLSFLQKAVCSQSTDINYLFMAYNGLLIFDDIQYALSEELKNFLFTLCRISHDIKNIQAKIIFTARDIEECLPSHLLMPVKIEGLERTEARKLLLKWNLSLEEIYIEKITAALNYNPQFLQIFYEWFISSCPDKRQLDTFIGQSAKTNQKLENYLLIELYEAYGGNDSDKNKLLKAISFLRIPEKEDLIEKLFYALEGAHFYETLKVISTRTALIKFNKELESYNVHDLIRDFYYHLFDNRESFHSQCAEFYNQINTNRPGILNHIEGAHHYLKGGKGQQAADFILPVFFECTVKGWFWSELQNMTEKVLDMELEEKTINRLHFELANLYSKTCEWDKAIEFYNKSLETFEKVGDIHGMAQTNGNISILAFEQKDYKNALKLHFEILFLFIKLGAGAEIKQASNIIQSFFQQLESEQAKQIMLWVQKNLSAEGVTWGRHDVLNADEVKQIYHDLQNQLAP